MANFESISQHPQNIFLSFLCMNQLQMMVFRWSIRKKLAWGHFWQRKRQCDIIYGLPLVHVVNNYGEKGRWWTEFGAQPWAIIVPKKYIDDPTSSSAHGPIFSDSFDVTHWDTAKAKFIAHTGHFYDHTSYKMQKYRYFSGLGFFEGAFWVVACSLPCIAAWVDWSHSFLRDGLRSGIKYVYSIYYHRHIL